MKYVQCSAADHSGMTRTCLMRDGAKPHATTGNGARTAHKGMTNDMSSMASRKIDAFAFPGAA
jgi:hypothetical protein